MLGVVIDTNVLISAALSEKGNPAKIIQLALDGKIKVYWDELIFLEYLDVLPRSKFSFAPETQDALIKGLKQIRVSALELPEITVSDIPLPDESDRVFYDVARSCGAYLITGNLKHYPVEPFIVTPAQFLDIWGALPGHSLTS